MCSSDLDKNYTELNNRKIGLKVVNAFIDTFSSLSMWLKDINNGRPLNIEDKKKYKFMKSELVEMANKFSYLFTANARSTLEDKLDEVLTRWRTTVSGAKQLQELERKVVDNLISLIAFVIGCTNYNQLLYFILVHSWHAFCVRMGRRLGLYSVDTLFVMGATKILKYVVQLMESHSPIQ